MGIERINHYSLRLIGLPKKVKAEPKPLEAKKSPAAEKAMAERRNEQEKLRKAAEQIKYEQMKMKQTAEKQKAEQDAMKVLITCLEISRRIISGDKVPPKDHQYLMEHDMALYAKSIMMRIPKKDPHEYDQLSEDEESNSPQIVMDTGTMSGSESSDAAPRLDVSI